MLEKPVPEASGAAENSLETVWVTWRVVCAGMLYRYMSV